MRRALVLAVALTLAVPAASLAAGTVALRPAAGAPGSAFTIKASGFPASRRVTVKAPGMGARVRTSRHGTFTVTLIAPAHAGWLKIVSRRGHRRVVNRFHVRGSGGGEVVELASSRGPRVRFFPSALLPGGRLQVRGTGFPARARLRLAGLRRRRHARAGRHGRVDVRMKVPAALSPGIRRLTVRGGGVRFRVRLRVLRPVPARVKPAIAASPGIAGAARVGAVLTASTGIWDGTAPIEHAYVWQRCSAAGGGCVNAPGATAPSYTVLNGDLGRRLRVVVIATNAAGSAQAASPLTTVVSNMPGVLSSPTLPTTVRQGQTIKASSATFTGSVHWKVTTQWQRCGNTCVDIGTNSTSYHAWAADVGFRLQVVQTATSSAGVLKLTSNKTDPVLPSATTTGVVALWHMNDTGATMLDSARHHDGTLHAVSAGLPGYSGAAFGFNGRNSDVTVPRASDLSAVDNNVTVTIWMKTRILPPTTVQDWDLIRSAGGYYDGDEYKMEYAPDGTAHCSFKGNGSTGYLEVTSSSSKPLNDGAWHMIKCVKTRTAVETIVDGMTYSRRGTIGTITITRGLILGAHANSAGNGASEFYDGALDEASIAFSAPS